MTRPLSLALVLLWTSTAHANPEINVDLPGGTTMEFVWIEPGTFMMGSPSYEPGRSDWEGPQHQVTITKGFYLGKYELTQGQWQAVMATPPWAGKDLVLVNPNAPAVYIAWNDARTFVAAMNHVAGDSLYRLPTEAEWEYACRAGTITPWSFGNDLAISQNYEWEYANTVGANEAYAHLVGTRRPNPWGLYDMHGNAWEWVGDWGGCYSGAEQADPAGPTSGSYCESPNGPYIALDTRLLRGGYWSHLPNATRSAARCFVRPVDNGSWSGARLVRSGPAPTSVAPGAWGQVKSGN